ncbi:MAG: bis(5'-nucleosyl)-tetraphosphatase [Pirellulales bacterium]
MPHVTSCGVILFRRQPELSFLLMRHANRWDLPKGHIEPGETEQQCALREFAEETGLEAADIQLQADFQWETSYPIRHKRTQEIVQKRLIVYLAWLTRDRPITVSEHQGYEWIRWQPPHRIQKETIDGVLEGVEGFWE